MVLDSETLLNQIAHHRASPNTALVSRSLRARIDQRR
jgi:hypothetical protein